MKNNQSLPGDSLEVFIVHISGQHGEESGQSHQHRCHQGSASGARTGALLRGGIDGTLLSRLATGRAGRCAADALGGSACALARLIGDGASIPTAALAHGIRSTSVTDVRSASALRDIQSALLALANGIRRSSHANRLTGDALDIVAPAFGGGYGEGGS